MYWLKACSRCHGDLQEIQDVGDHYISCIQCGRILTVEQENLLPRARTTIPKAMVLAARKISTARQVAA